LIDKFWKAKRPSGLYLRRRTVLIPGLMEQLERAGVHSGDSMPFTRD